MASNGLLKRAKKGTCRMCFRVRSTENHVKEVGTVSHGFATGHIWQCIDINDCEKAIEKKLKVYHPDSIMYNKIITAIKNGRSFYETRI